MTREELLDKALHCNRCGTCRGVTQDAIPNVAFATQCPCGSTFFGCYEPSGLMYMARGIAMGNLQWNEDLAKVLYACTLCGYCDDFCQRGYRHTPAIAILEELRRDYPATNLSPKACRKPPTGAIPQRPQAFNSCKLRHHGHDGVRAKRPTRFSFPTTAHALIAQSSRKSDLFSKKSGKKIGCFISDPLPPVNETLIFGGCDDALAACMAELMSSLKTQREESDLLQPRKPVGSQAQQQERRWNSISITASMPRCSKRKQQRS